MKQNPFVYIMLSGDEESGHHLEIIRETELVYD